jgi:YHS domain-containing protein
MVRPLGIPRTGTGFRESIDQALIGGDRTLSGSRPERVLDPVCGMTVDIAKAEEAGLTIEYDGRTYAFCGSGCRRAFQEEPAIYAAKAEQAHAITVPQSAGLPVIDEGMRRWYESCSCCLSDAYPDIKAALDAERAANAEAPVQAGICEVAEAQEVAGP